LIAPIASAQRHGALHPPRIVRGEMGDLATAVAAELLEERLRRPDRALGLATGRTMAPVYRALTRLIAELPEGQRELLRRRWLSFNLDEYVGLGGENPGSFAAYMNEHLTGPLGLPVDRVLLPDGRAADPAAEARRYAGCLDRAGGIGLQLLGLGVNGHVGFNEPPSGADAPCRVVDLCPTTRARNATDFSGADTSDSATPGSPVPDSGSSDSDATANAATTATAAGPRQPHLPVPERAITLGMREILAADRLLLVVSGSAKAGVLHRALLDLPSADLPASWLRCHPRVTLYADDEALSALEPHAEAVALAS
jgi:glucosamine-6-phosphate deaminase